MEGDVTDYTVADLEREDVFDVPSFDNDDAVGLGLAAIEVIDERGLDLAVRIVLRGDIVFQAKLGASGPWLAGKAAVAEHFGEPSLLVRLRHEQAGDVFEDRTDVDHTVLRASGGSIPLRVQGKVVGSITTSGEPDVVDHATSAEALRRYLAERSFATS
jgi:uncharacterized protein (UPF0303 family)